MKNYFQSITVSSFLICMAFFFILLLVTPSFSLQTNVAISESLESNVNSEDMINFFLNDPRNIFLGLNLETSANNNENDLKLEDTLIKIQSAIRKKGVNWSADYNAMFNSTIGADISALGCIIDDVDEDEHSKSISSAFIDNSFPASFDWRNFDNSNWMTSVKNQASCGSCVAFGTMSAFEAVLNIELGTQLDSDYDFSEAHLFFCGGGSCSQGWTIGRAVNYLEDFGVPSESCFPYVPRNMDCNQNCPDWELEAVKIIEGGRVGGFPPSNISAVQDALVTYGPLITSYTVYQDFSAYTSGVYEHVYGDVRGGHVVAIVGYDNTWGNESEGYWICKNSWGKHWGESGYFRIKYGECGIGTTFNTYYINNLYGGICESYLPKNPSNPIPFDDEINVDEASSITLQWDGGDPNLGDNVSYEIYFGTNEIPLYVQTIGPFDAEQKQITVTIDTEIKENSHYYWKIIAIDDHDARRDGSLWDFYTVDILPPTVNITRPLPGYFYKNSGLFRKQIPSSLNTIIFGDILVTGVVSDEGSGIKNTDVLIDNKIQSSFNEEKISWLWDKLSLGKHTLTIKTEDIAGNVEIDEIVVWKLF